MLMMFNQRSTQRSHCPCIIPHVHTTMNQPLRDYSPVSPHRITESDTIKFLTPHTPPFQFLMTGGNQKSKWNGCRETQQKPIATTRQTN